MIAQAAGNIGVVFDGAREKEFCARFLHSADAVLQSKKPIHSSNGSKVTAARINSVFGMPLVLLLPQSSCFFKAPPRGHAARPCGAAGNQAHITNLCPTKARIFFGADTMTCSFGGWLTDEHLRSQVKPPGPPFDVVIPISLTSPGTRLLQNVVIPQIPCPFWVLLIN